MKKALSILYLIPPVYALLAIWPIVRELPPFHIADNVNIFQVLIVLPFYFGLLACPGYVYACVGTVDQEQLTHRGRLFVGISLWLALLCSMAGLISILAVTPFPGVVGSIVSCNILLYKFHRSRKKSVVQSKVRNESANQAL